MPGSPELSRSVGRIPQRSAQTQDVAGPAEAARPEKGDAGGRPYGVVGAPRSLRRDEPPDEVLLRVVYEEHGQAVLAYANRLAPTDRPDVGYAMIFPAMTIVKVLFVDVVLALL